MRILLSALTVLLAFVTLTGAWDTEELEIFDLVEDINENFYTVLGVQQDATLQEIKRAFRNLSVIMHPDKSDAEDANIKFRNLVFVYEVLKDSSKREKYNDVLKNGLPNWKSAMYYYRRVHKMGLAEMSIILFGILTVGQYIISWAAYVEKKYTAESLFGSKLRRMQKKNKTNVDMDTILNEIPAPSVFNTLPFQIPRAIWNIPKAVKGGYDSYREYVREQQDILDRQALELERQKEQEEEYVREKEAKKEGIRKRKEKFAAQEKTDEELEGFARLRKLKKLESIKAAGAKNALAGGLWTDDDLTELVRLVKKYPGGTPARWEVIAEMMSRSVTEITFMAAKMKENGYRVPGQTDSVAEAIVQDSQKKLKAKQSNDGNQILVPETNWSQEQQQSLEVAIVKYPKTVGSDRWIKISGCIPGKTKEECLARYKHLVEVVKAQRAKDLKANIVEPEQSEAPSANGVQHELSQVDEPLQAAKGGGKPRNRRKDRKNKMQFSSDEDDED